MDAQQNYTSSLQIEHRSCLLLDPVDGDQPHGLLLRAQGAVRHRLDLHPGRDLRPARLAHDGRLPGRDRGRDPVHEHDLLHRADGLPPRGGDISWILGLIVASGLYFLLHRSLRVSGSGAVAPAAAAERAS